MLYCGVVGALKESLPSRERGLKLYCVSASKKERCVAPLAGAWIEIALMENKYKIDTVAPLAGAWIEIDCTKSVTIIPYVAPLAGAWIEIAKDLISLFAVMTSLPSRERGLK